MIYIVNKQHISQVTIDHPQILDVETFIAFPATISEVSMRNQSFLVDIVDNDICVAFVTGCEDYQLVVSSQLF
jgi:hypothetical protein